MQKKCRIDGKKFETDDPDRWACDECMRLYNIVKSEPVTPPVPFPLPGDSRPRFDALTKVLGYIKSRSKNAG